ncbi:hypothetical protein MUN78_08115 [Leucobacter allii]|uniref:Uncharacterized protein n=1 Tax=Leucobacter allii TaxID=2932247 RepID=A0ABY4FRH1_9MICO|nr:hypothetical protein [Leucobacter allii]UOQ58769.1 hypothetical protein MUN78_08115 [Leucobacter allii]
MRATFGWALAFDEKTRFAINIGEDTYRCRLQQEARRGAVQHKRPLPLEIDEGWHERWWADRRRWTLAAKLPGFFAALDDPGAP